MENRRLAWWRIGVAFLLLGAGCQSMYCYRPVAIQARDAETKQPIPGADIHIAYPYAPASKSPYESSGTTGPDGVAQLRAAPYGETGVRLEATATGYLSEQKFLPVEAVAAVEPAHFFEKVEDRPVSFVIELYSGATPTVELVVPTGYHGVVKVAVEARDDIPCPPGQRSFRYEVPWSGEVQVIGPSLLSRVVSSDFHAHYADGTPLSPRAKDTEVGWWWLKYDGRCHHFLVGTLSEYNLQHLALEKEEATHVVHPTGDDRGSGGRRGRRGGSS
jgi:hypothetical protein